MSQLSTRLLRTFRVLRLFSKLRSLRTLITALASSLVAVVNAFVIVILVSVVYAILGVQLFQVPICSLRSVRPLIRRRDRYLCKRNLVGYVCK